MVELSVSDFLDQLGSPAPVPGGGSVAALTGAQAAGLVAMVCHLTIGKKRYAEYEAELKAVLAEADALRADLTNLLQADVEAYAGLNAAYRLPKDAPGRAEAIQASLIPATEVPLQIAEKSAAVFDLAPVVVQKGSKVAVSDAGMAALLAAAAIRSGALNVRINLAALTDEAAKADFAARLNEALGDRINQAEGVYADVVGRIGG